jgi:hypothetical protein
MPRNDQSHHFARGIDAQTWLDEVTTSVRTGTYADPGRGRVTVGEWGPMWPDGQAHLKPSTRERYAGILREHVLPAWSTVPLAEVTHAEVKAWVTACLVAVPPRRCTRSIASSRCC